MDLLALSVIPAIILFVLVYRDDKIEKEPPRLLIRLFCYGMLCVPIVMLPELLGDRLCAAAFGEGTLSYGLFMYIGVVGVCEEGAKYLFLRPTRKNPNFNYTFDGIVYAVCIGLGFAALENVMYVAGYADYSLAIIRGISAVPMHCSCAVFMGYYFGLAHRSGVSGQVGKSRTFYILALIVPILMHGFYDFGVSSDSDAIRLVALAFIIFVFIFAIVRVRRSSKQDQMIMP